MKARFNSNFEYGKRISKYTMVGAVLCGLTTVLLTPPGSILQLIFLLSTTAFMVATFVVIYKNCRCPYCGKHIMMGALRVKVCPACNRSLENGRKTKKYER